MHAQPALSEILPKARPIRRQRALLRRVAATALVLAAQSTLATPFPATVQATLSGSSWIVPTVVEQGAGPIEIGEAPTEGQFVGARTDYGSNAASASMWANRPSGAPQTGHFGWASASSKWTDRLTLFTPDVPLGDPVAMVFTIHLGGFLEGTMTDFVSLGASVRYQMLLNEHGSWVTRPMLWHDLWESSGGAGHHDRIDIDEVQAGRFTVPNGATFNLISELSTRVQGEFWGPWDTSFSVQSSFGNTVRWLGGEVWVGNGKASTYTITSASGFDYGQPAVAVAEPSVLAQMSVGLVGLALARWWRARGPRRRESGAAWQHATGSATATETGSAAGACT
jgi:hypothetical protein